MIFFFVETPEQSDLIIRRWMLEVRCLKFEKMRCSRNHLAGSVEPIRVHCKKWWLNAGVNKDLSTLWHIFDDAFSSCSSCPSWKSNLLNATTKFTKHTKEKFEKDLL